MPAQQAYQPKANHPWRQYRNRKTEEQDNAGEDSLPKISLQIFLKDIVENWDTYKIPPINLEDREYISLARIKPEKQAEWLIGFVRKHCLIKQKGALIFE